MVPARGVRPAIPSQAIRLATLSLAALALSCGDSEPARITCGAFPAVIVDNALHPLGATVINAKGEVLSGRTVAYAVAPDGIAEVSSSGGLRCLKTGDAMLSLSGGGLTAPVPVKCRLPAEIVMPQDLRLVIGEGSVALRPRAIGEGGKSLDDAPVALTSSNPAVVAVEGERVKPVAVGRARLQASAGVVTAVTPVEVDEKVVSEHVAFADGASRSWDLKEGDYRVEIDVKPEVQIAQGVAVSWSGTGCEAQPEKPSHRFGCRVLERATMTVTNPRTMGVGARVTGTLAIFRVPPS